jgi:serine/threonine protein kinase
MSPEYAVHGQYSIKSDVFSFGVLILEIVSGKKNKGFCHPEHHLNLLGHVSMKYDILLIYVVKQDFLLIVILFQR